MLYNSSTHVKTLVKNIVTYE